MLGTLLGPDQPVAAWQGYEQFDSPARRVRLELLAVFAADVEAAIERIRQRMASGS